MANGMERLDRDLDVVDVIVQCLQFQYGDALGDAAKYGLDTIRQRVADARQAIETLS